MTNAMPLSLQKLKYRFYAVLLPVFLLVASMGWYEEFKKADKDPANMIIMPTLIVLYLISIFVLFFKKDWSEAVEKFMIIAVCLVSAVKFTYVVTHELEQTMSLGPFTFWMPMFYMFLFFLLNIRWALIVTAATYVWFLGVGIYKLPDLMGTPASFLLIHYFFANLVFLVTLFFLHTVKQSYIKAEVLEEMANTDYLTGLPNRRKIDMELMKGLETQQKLSIIYLDIDHFKQINDSYGHTAGDMVLKEFTNKTLEILDKEDLLGRWGGEEFMLLLKNRDIGKAKLLAEKIRKHISQHDYETINSLTASFGVAELQGGDTLDSLLNRADKALYEAKNNGRNQVAVNEQ
ncbi:GGDEF domain-containing protein [Rossellomorea vietnamensis]|uniref:GGDEF domain-containing protein n=1 Tax=Rossellomorea vietnamensis TaxID=218284 RepID=A0A5D4KH10_9BACI|nr:GGDEF domain-containing protein [Rossellomorea vietnamensis]TYR75985.1 GGDEF domain-containing protein [Rossellomorea vietnamensis]